MSTENLPPRNKSQRLIEKKHKEEKNAENLERFKSISNIENPRASDVLPGLNELTDSLNAFPSDVIGYFTLLKEIDAKCVFTVPYLKAYIERFLKMKKSHPKRNLLLSKIRNCIKELMPCLEEKMHVATIASNTVNKHISRIDQFYNIVTEKEIPKIIQIGPMWDPCMKVTEPKTAQQQRSESRREALAAKKANKGSEIDDDINNNTDDNSFYDDNIQIQSKKSNKNLKKETNQFQTQNHNHNENVNHNLNHSNNNYSHPHSNLHTSLTKKRKVEDPHDIIKSNSSNIKKLKSGKSKKENRKEVINSDALNSNHAIKSHLIPSTNSRKEHHNISNNNNNVNYNSTIDNDNNDLSDNISNFNKSKNKKEEIPTSPINYDGEPVYCYCQQVSYGEMVGCDGANCEKEWFHLPCTGLKELPKGEWYCDECKAKM